jgi:hypothetical protein
MDLERKGLGSPMTTADNTTRKPPIKPSTTEDLNCTPKGKSRSNSDLASTPPAGNENVAVGAQKYGTNKRPGKGRSDSVGSTPEKVVRFQSKDGEYEVMPL